MKNTVIDLEKDFSKIFDSIQEPIVLIDENQNVVKANKKAHNEFKLTEKSSIEDVFTFDNEKQIAQMKNHQVIYTFTKHKFDNDKALLIFQPFKSPKNYFEEILSRVPVGVVIFNKQGKVVYHNNAFDELWGVNDEILKDYNLFEDEVLYSTKVIDQIKQVFEDKPYLFLEGYYDSLLERGKGYKIWVESFLFPLKNNSDEVEFVVITHKDISEVKLAQEEIKIAKDKADEANRLKNAFLENLSHEIRTPLNAIIGFGNIIADLVKDKIDQSDYELLHNFNIGIRRLFRTLTQILELSQVDTGNYELKIEPVNLEEEVKKVIADLNSDIKQKNLDVVLSLDPAHPTVLADKPALNRILTNLIENAVKFTNKGYIKIESYSNYNETILFCSIKDTGIGISEEYLDHIFEPFSQEEDGFNRPFEGNGLGLALTKRYLDLINSSITVDSVKGVGSTFTFTLPIYKS